MKKFYTAAFLVICAASVMAQSTQPTEAGKKHNFLNNPGELLNAQTPGFFQFPVKDRSAYEQMKQREMNTYKAFGAGNTDELMTSTDYDVKYYRLDLRLNPDSSAGKYVRGSVTTYFTTLTPNFSIIKFDFASALLCDSVYYHGVKRTSGVLENLDTLEITLPNIPTLGTLDSVTVYYKGVPPTTAGFSNGTGFVKSTHGSPAQNYIYTLSEPYSAFTWWPCKSRITNDKADSIDIIVSTPSTFKVAANGIIASEIVYLPNNRVTHWKHRYPISSYQVAVGIANYVQYPASPTMVNIGGTMMPYFNLIFPESNTTNAHTALDRTPLMITTMSDKFGDYPFKKEKYGHYSFGFGGGMEHNTFSGMNPGTYDQVNDWDVIAHELAHQWWGASVTCGSWQDIWVNESFATYSEIVTAEFSPTTAPGTTALAHRQGIKNIAKSTSYQAEPVVQIDTTDINSIFNPSVYVYERGCMVISMLRTLLGDAKFFQALKNYQADPLLKYKNAYTADVQRHMEAVSGLNLSGFFSDWIYNRGFAEYNAAKWNNAGNLLALYLPQTVKLATVTKFRMPIAVRVQGSNPATMDTLLIMYDDNGIISKVDNGTLLSAGGNLVTYNLPFTPVTVTFDAYSQVLANGSFAKDASITVLANNAVNFYGRKVGADASLTWDIENPADYTAFELEKSEDGTHFSSIAMLKAADNQGKSSFAYTDLQLTSGTHYYRVKTLKQDGVYMYSKVIPITADAGSTQFVITPNPAKTFINIYWKGSQAGPLKVRIYDAGGKLVRFESKQHTTTGSGLTISAKGLQAGNYFVELESETGEKASQKLVIIP